MINTQFIVLMIALISFAFIVVVQLQEADNDRLIILDNVVKGLERHQNETLDALPQSNFTAQRIATERIANITQDLQEIKSKLNITE